MYKRQDLTTPTRFNNSVFVGLGLDIPIRQPWGAQLNMNAGIARGAKESPRISAGVSGVSDISIYLGGYYHLNPRMSVRFGFHYFGNKAEFQGGESATHRVFIFTPSLLYYF